MRIGTTKTKSQRKKNIYIRSKKKLFLEKKTRNIYKPETAVKKKTETREWGDEKYVHAFGAIFE